MTHNSEEERRVLILDRRVARHRPRDGEALFFCRLAGDFILRHPFPEECPWDAGADDHLQVDLADPEVIRAVAEVNEAEGARRPGRRARQQCGDFAERRPGGLSPLGTRLEDWKTVFQVNFFAPIMLARGLIGELEAASGSVVNVTSIAGSRVHPFAGSAYATSKAALAALTREMAADFAPRGIRVNAISPARSTRPSSRPVPRRSSPQFRWAASARPRKWPRPSIFSAPSSRATSTAPSCISMAASTCEKRARRLSGLGVGEREEVENEIGLSGPVGARGDDRHAEERDVTMSRTNAN